ncbi:hypothetical protein GCM10020295_43620 [Streptomyces cinereospinus]
MTHGRPAVSSAVRVGGDQVGMVVGLDALALAVVLAGRGGVDEVELRAVLEDERDGVGLDEPEGVAGLGVFVDAGHVEPGVVVALAGAALAAVHVEQARPAAGHSPEGSRLGHAGRPPQVC